jgi:LytS/YehU family sensor histidine kinase
LRLSNELTKEKVEKKIKETELQKRINDMSFSALRSQMNPHFIFNALNTVQSYVYANDKKSATNYLGKFSELIRKVLDNSSKRAITLQEEIELLQLYVDIEKARFGDNFYAAIETDPTLDIEYTLVPPMLIQPYIENATKHGLLHKQGEKNLTVTFQNTEDDESIQIIIDDNGVGRETSKELNSKKLNHNSFANGANEKRIGLMGQLYNKKASVEIIDKKNLDGSAAGTKVVINIPAKFSPES